MNITLHTKGIELLEEEKEYAQETAKKLLHRSKIFEEIDGVQMKIEIDKEPIKIHKEQFFCAFTLFLPAKNIRAEAHSAGVYSAIDSAFEVMDKKLHQEKERHAKATPLPEEE